jgi:hypothetical protein
MSEAKSIWWRDLLFIPLIVGLIVALFTFGLPKLFEKEKQITYEIDGPTTYLDKQSIGNVSVVVNGVPTSNLFSYKVHLLNSGDQPLKNLPVLVLFETDLSEFKIFSVRHETKPSHEFGNIMQEDIDHKSKRFVFELLNPKDQDTISFLTNNSASLKLFAKLEGLRVKGKKPQKGTTWFGITSTILAVVASLLSLLLRFIPTTSEKKHHERLRTTLKHFQWEKEKDSKETTHT